MSSSRADNISAVAEPAQCQATSASSTTTCELTDHAWAQAKYDNFRLFVGTLVVQEPRLEEWASWLLTIPLSIFLAAGCGGELKGVREASDDAKSSEEAGLVLSRWGLTYGFDLEKITAGDKLRLTRYILLFASC